MGWLNASRRTTFSGVNGAREMFIFLFSSYHEQDWQTYPVDPYSALICDE